MNILQVGLGNFGLNHLRAWHELGFGETLYIAELNPVQHKCASAYRFPSNRINPDPMMFWDKAEAVDIVTGTDTHFDLCQKALLSGKDVFIEKPMTMTLEEANRLAELVHKTKRILQVGYYYRYHPVSRYVYEQIRSGRLGRIRYLYGYFMGFKRPRKDVGVMHTDGIHFIDLFNWFLDGLPVDVYAETRDHFSRGMEDFAIALFTYPGDILAKVECGYIQPGESSDKVVPGAMTTKSIGIVGSEKTLTADYEAERVEVFDVHHEMDGGWWRVVNKGSHVPRVGSASTIDLICAELKEFLSCTETRETPRANVETCGVNLARIIESVHESARRRSRVLLAR